MQVEKLMADVAIIGGGVGGCAAALALAEAGRKVIMTEEAAWIGGQLKERPSAIFKEHVRVAPYPEDDIPRLVHELDGDDRVLVFGSDFPHAEGVVRPADFQQLLQPLPDDMQRRIMRDNAAAIFDGTT